ncbi:MAG: PEP-CTERM sorting domain-containing protein [Microcoleaceae cyanobacterium MO_207.B10]|nr:PEP-CTERM sorting domain-containing protein [Microcoleaceae cyanobacterium MO_207.B10]
MKTQLSILLTALVGGVMSGMPAQAASFGNDGIMFNTDTEVEFNFLQSHGWWRGDFGVKNLDTGVETILLSEDLNANPGSGEHNDSLGTAGFGLAVTNPLASFTFTANNNYTFFLTSYNKDGSNPYEGKNWDYANTQYSTTSLNPSWYNQGTGVGAQGDGTFVIGDAPEEYNKNLYNSSLNGMVVSGQERALFLGDLFGEGANILFEDNTSYGNNDFDDFVVKATAIESTPEPATMAGLGIVIGGMILSRSGKKQK